MSTPHHGGQLMRIPELAAYLGIGRTTAYDWLKGGKLPGVVNVAGQWFARKPMVDAWLLGQHDGEASGTNVAEEGGRHAA